MKRAFLLAAMLPCLVAAGCGTAGRVGTPGAAPGVVSAAAKGQSGLVPMSFRKAGGEATKTPTSSLKPRATRGQPFKAGSPHVMVDLRSRQDLSDQDVKSIANFALVGMHKAQSYESGYNSGVVALKQIDAQLGGKNPAARFGVRASGAARSYQSAFQQVSVTLAFLRDGKAPTGRALFSLALDIQSGTSSTTYEDGGRAGYEILAELQSSYPDAGVQTAAKIAYQSASAATTWEDTYNVINAALVTFRDQAQ